MARTGTRVASSSESSCGEGATRSCLDATRTRLARLAAGHPGVVARAATIESPNALDRAMEGAAAVINCAGPFAFTAAPVIDAALRARIPYLDVMAEPEIAEATFDDYDVAPAGVWTLPDPIGAQPVAFEFTTADCVTISSHLTVGAIGECITVAPLADLSDPDLSGPRAVDDIGRSAQTFLLEAIVRRGPEERSVVVTGQDIYAVSAPIVVELTERLLTSHHITGVVAAGAIADPLSVLLALSPNHLAVETDL
jgi:Saccharopine dehydrogenase NADP binding domain